MALEALGDREVHDVGGMGGAGVWERGLDTVGGSTTSHELRDLVVPVVRGVSRPEMGPVSRRHTTASRSGAPSRCEVVDWDQGPVGNGAGEPRWTLRRLLVMLDVVAVAVAWMLSQAIPGSGVRQTGMGNVALWASVVVIVVGTIMTIGTLRLYWSRVCSVSAEESSRLLRAALVSGAVALALSAFAPVYSPAECLMGTGLTFVLLRATRSMFRSWIQSARRQGRFTRPIVIVGDNEDAAEIHSLLTDHPEIGYRVCGIVGRPDRIRELGLPVRHVGDSAAAARAVTRAGANGAILAVTAMSSSEARRVARELLAAGIHVHLSSGIPGIAHRRLRVQQFAQQPMIYLEAAVLTSSQAKLKRCIDLAVGGAALVLASPVMLLAAVAILVTSGRPIIFRQERVGRYGTRFAILKFRTMVQNAEGLLIDLREQNVREGPLFKLASDPRVTRVGRVLRALSIDELPQLFNVLKGEMSLVGPRPALPSEVDEFDDELTARQEVAPGITGLWQVEARDNPSFSAYRRLDLFYLENWSVFLDITILLATARVLVYGILQVIGRRSRSRGELGPIAVLE